MTKEESVKVTEMIHHNFEFASSAAVNVRPEGESFVVYIYLDKVEGMYDIMMELSHDRETIFVSGKNVSINSSIGKDDGSDPYFLISAFLFTTAHVIKELEGEEGVIKRSKQKLSTQDSDEVKAIGLVYEVIDENTSYGTMLTDFSKI